MLRAVDADLASLPQGAHICSLAALAPPPASSDHFQAATDALSGFLYVCFRCVKSHPACLVVIIFCSVGLTSVVFCCSQDKTVQAHVDLRDRQGNGHLYVTVADEEDGKPSVNEQLLSEGFVRVARRTERALRGLAKSLYTYQDEAKRNRVSVLFACSGLVPCGLLILAFLRLYARFCSHRSFTLQFQLNMWEYGDIDSDVEDH